MFLAREFSNPFARRQGALRRCIRIAPRVRWAGSGCEETPTDPVRSGMDQGVLMS